MCVYGRETEESLGSVELLHTVFYLKQNQKKKEKTRSLVLLFLKQMGGQTKLALMSLTLMWP